MVRPLAISCAALALVVLTVASRAPALPADRVSVTAEGDTVTVEVPGFATMADLALALQPQLGAPVRLPDDAKSVKLGWTGRVDVARFDLRSFLAVVLEHGDLFLVPSEHGSGEFLDVVSGDSLPRSPLQSLLIASATDVEPDELEAWAGRREYVRVVVPLTYLDARNAMSMCNPLCDVRIGQVRSTTEPNALVIVERADVVRQIVALLRRLDAPSLSVDPPVPTQLAELSARLGELSAKVDALEAGR